MILEGFEYSLGFTPKSLLNSYVKSSDKEFYKWGEPAYTAIKAAESGIPFVGGEPDEIEIKRGVLNAGFTAVDLAMYYFVRQLPQFKRDGSLKSRSIEQIYPEYMKNTYSLLKIAGDSPSFEEFKHWYLKKNKKPFDLKTFDNEETSPQEKGQFYTQKIGHAVGMVRDRYVVKLIADMLNKKDRVMIVFGKSHLAQQRRALVSMLGKPVKESI